MAGKIYTFEQGAHLAETLLMNLSAAISQVDSAAKPDTVSLVYNVIRNFFDSNDITEQPVRFYIMGRLMFDSHFPQVAAEFSLIERDYDLSVVLIQFLEDEIDNYEEGG